MLLVKCSLHHREWFKSFHQAQVHTIWRYLIQFLFHPTRTLGQTLQLHIHFDPKQPPKEIACRAQNNPVCMVSGLPYNKFHVGMVWVIHHLPPLCAERGGGNVDPWSCAVHWKLRRRRNTGLNLCMRILPILALGLPVCRNGNAIMEYVYHML